MKYPSLSSSLDGGKRQSYFENKKMNIREFTNLLGSLIKERSILKICFDKKIPMDEYGFYKYVCAKYSENSQNIYDLVIFGIYGKYEDYLYRFISNSIIKNLLKMPIVINQNVVFDYLYINDLVKIVGYFISHKPKYKIFT